MNHAILGSFSILTTALLVGCGAADSQNEESTQASADEVTAADGFIMPCLENRRLMDDPIVLPGLPGASHSHDFYGNRTTNAYSTYATMIAGTSSCHLPEDTAGYWVPTLYFNGAVVNPVGAKLYYRRYGIVGAIRPFPADLRVVAGNGHATGEQSTTFVYWGCGNGSSISKTSSMPTCLSGENLVAHVKFPNCWDGVHLDSPDHKSHMAYSSGSSCPSTHPVAMPKLIERFEWPIRGGSGVTLSAGPYYTLHADFWNTWQQAKLEAVVQQCFNTSTACGEF